MSGTEQCADAINAYNIHISDDENDENTSPCDYCARGSKTCPDYKKRGFFQVVG